MSLKLALERGANVALGLGDERHTLWVRRPGQGRRVEGGRGARMQALVPASSPARGGWLHLQAVSRRGAVEVSLGRRRFRLRGRAGTRFSLAVAKGAVRLDDVIATRRRDRAGLLLHRIADLDSRVPRRRFLVGADRADRLHLVSRFWTRGYLAGALWRASELAQGTDLFEQAAVERTQANLGYERADSHDVGLIYENSSVAALGSACRRPQPAQGRARCRRFRASALRAARTLLELADSNPGGGTIPTRAHTPSFFQADTIIDSLMNVPLLYWASRVTGDGRFREVAARHVRRVGSLLVRPDGSTAQSVHLDRLTGEVRRVHTHQGLSDTSTWARGQGWAVYGFTASAAALRDQDFLRLAERTAGWVEEHLPPSGMPPYDYDVPGGAPGDASAAVITAAGLFRLDALCHEWRSACQEPGRWRRVATRLLATSLERASAALPLGFLGGQVGSYGGAHAWDDQAELIYGLSYGLEAISLRRRAGR